MVNYFEFADSSSDTAQNQQPDLNSVLALPWAGDWTRDFPKSPPVWMILWFRNTRREFSGWHAQGCSTWSITDTHPLQNYRALSGLSFYQPRYVLNQYFEPKVKKTTAVKARFWLWLYLQTHFVPASVCQSDVAPLTHTIYLHRSALLMWERSKEKKNKPHRNKKKLSIPHTYKKVWILFYQITEFTKLPVRTCSLNTWKTFS